MKRAFDLFLSGAGILVSAPLWGIIALAVYLADGGPVFFIQKRVGKDKRVFNAYKFRTMKVLQRQDEVKVQASENDPRVTGPGRLLRATAMDELPQLVNIFKGDMSFVGPRALMPDEIELHGKQEDEEIVRDLFEKRCSVVPGLTGVAQVFAARDVPRRKKFRYDLFYIRKQSFGLDLKLIFVSFLITFLGNWENRGVKLNVSRRAAEINRRKLKAPRA